MPMKRIHYLIAASILSLLYNCMLLLAVSLNMDWVRTRAAGGQFETFPIGIRISYFLMASLMGTLIFWLWDHRSGILMERSKKFARIVGYIFTISTALQLLSRSIDERWNAIPAAILAITFLILGKKNSK